MEILLKNRKKQAEHTIISLFVLLFFISFIESFRLLAITAGFVVVYSLLTCGGKNFLKLTKSGLPFVILLLIPTLMRFLLSGTWEDLDFTMMIICKIIISALLLGTVVSKHSAMYLVDGILNLGLPPLFNRILALTFRYFHLVNADVSMGRKALTSRGINERKGLTSLNIFGEWIGGFFLKSIHHSDMVFNAMRARGFQGVARNETYKDKRLIFETSMLILLLMTVLIIDGKV